MSLVQLQGEIMVKWIKKVIIDGDNILKCHFLNKNHILKIHMTRLIYYIQHILKGAFYKPMLKLRQQKIIQHIY